MANSYNNTSSSDLRVNRVMVMRVALVLLGLMLICYVERRSQKYPTALAASSSSCLPCSCDCISDPTLSLPLEVINSSFADCGKDDPETYNEMKKDLVALFSEEISLHENVTTDTLQRTKALIMGAKRTSTHFQKESEKCIAGMETCEEAREKAEVALIQERKLTALWISRAQEYGWKDDTNEFL